VGLLSVAFAIALDAALRSIFASPITGVRDAGALFISVVIAASFSACIAERSNITIRFLGSALGGRWQEYLDVFGNLVTAAFFGLMARQIWLHANELALNNDTTIVLGWPLAPWWRVVSILIAFCVPTQIVVIYQICKRSAPTADR
jgi:TRAP-type C4-dicarboxylate transport system permease small subunit